MLSLVVLLSWVGAVCPCRTRRGPAVLRRTWATGTELTQWGKTIAIPGNALTSCNYGPHCSAGSISLPGAKFILCWSKCTWCTQFGSSDIVLCITFNVHISYAKLKKFNRLLLIDASQLFYIYVLIFVHKLLIHNSFQIEYLDLSNKLDVFCWLGRTISILSNKCDIFSCNGRIPVCGLCSPVISHLWQCLPTVLWQCLPTGLWHVSEPLSAQWRGHVWRCPPTVLWHVSGPPPAQ